MFFSLILLNIIWLQNSLLCLPMIQILFICTLLHYSFNVIGQYWSFDQIHELSWDGWMYLHDEIHLRYEPHVPILVLSKYLASNKLLWAKKTSIDLFWPPLTSTIIQSENKLQQIARPVQEHLCWRDPS